MISYSQCWEDAEIVVKALNLNNDDTVLSVTSGGCNSLAIASMGVKTVFSVDKNRAQNFLLEFKQQTVRCLEYEEVLEVLGYRNRINRVALYQNIQHNLSEGCQKYWDSKNDAIKKGVVHCGKFERYLRIFRRYVIPLVHSKATIQKFLNPEGSQNQIDFYTTKWNTFRWRLLFRIFFSRFVMSRSGRSKEMFSHSQNLPAAKLFFNRTEQAFKYGQVKQNFFLSYILLGSKSELLPHYLHYEMFEKLKSLSNIQVHSSDILSFLKSMPSSSISKFNLSDVFEPLDIIAVENIFNEIYRVSKPNARIIFWNNLVHRDVPQELVHCFEREVILEEELKKNDRVFFYEKFYIYKVVK
jgi:S-adenosylmethionine-diacylglycerol 3-amino-3-carboxypropyl transferase